MIECDLELSRSRIKRLIEAGAVTVNGKLAKPSTRLNAGELIDLVVPEPTVPRAIPQQIELAVVYEDSDVIVINKAAGMVVHPAPGHPDGTLVNALLHHCGDLSGIGGELRPGIVHRIDKDTSGLLVATKNDETHAALAKQFAAHTIEREYVAVCAPPPKSASGSFRTLHGRHPKARKKFSSLVQSGKTAITHYVVEQKFADLAAVLRCRLETGRTHQIRVHFSDAGSPLLGDPLYARKRHGKLGEMAAALGRQALHAAVLGFVHPNGQPMHFEVELPGDLAVLISGLEEITA